MLRLFLQVSTSAMALASRAAHPKIKSVKYPGLPTHPGHMVAKEQMRRFGSLIGVTFADAEQAERFITSARFVRPATSFGGTHTSAERRARWAIKCPRASFDSQSDANRPKCFGPK